MTHRQVQLDLSKRRQDRGRYRGSRRGPLPIERLEVDRGEVRARGNSGFGERLHDGVSSQLRSETHGVNEPAHTRRRGTDANRADPGDVQPLCVTRRDACPLFEQHVETSKLPEAQGRAHVVEAVVEAKARILHRAGIVVAPLVAQAPKQSRPLGIVGGHDASFAHRHLLVGEEAKHRGGAECSHLPSLGLCRNRLARVLDAPRSRSVASWPVGRRREPAPRLSRGPASRRCAAATTGGRWLAPPGDRSAPVAPGSDRCSM